MNNLTNTQENAVAMGNDFMAMGGVALGFENIGQEDLMLGKIKLIQMTSTEVAEKKASPGQFFNSQTGEAKDEVVCYFMQVNKPRSAFERPYKKGSKPKCRSIDGKIGIKADGTKRHCEGCVERDWDAAKAAGKTKPDCTESYAWLGALMEDDAPFRLTCSGDNVKITKAFINSLIYKKVAMLCHVVKLTSTQVTNDKGTYYVVKYDLVETYTPESFKKLAEPKRNELNAIWGARAAMTTSLMSFFNRALDMDTSEMDHESATEGNSQSEANTDQGNLF